MVLAHWETHSLTSDDVDMQVKNSLPTIESGVNNQAVTILIDAILQGNLASHFEQVTGQGFIF